MLHERDSIRDELLDEVFASSDLSVSLPKFRFPESEHLPRHAYQVVADELMLDGNSRQNLATFCQTWFEPEVALLMAETLDKNMVDKDEYPQTAAIEARCVHMLADLWNSPDAENTLGTSTTGLERSSDARRPGAPVELAGAPSSGGACPPTSRTSSPARCRCAGTSSPATGTSSCARSRWRATA